MAKNIFLIVLIATIFAFIYLVFFRSSPLTTIPITIKNQAYQLEVAQTVSQKTLGLGKRNYLCPTCGMIFVFQIEMPQVFWMKDTLIPLDMIFLDKSGQIINIVTATPEPGIPDSQLKLYRSASPAAYVIELNAGEAQKINLVPHDYVSIPQL